MGYTGGPLTVHLTPHPTANEPIPEPTATGIDARQWFVIQTKAREEQRVCTRLTEDAFVTFLPQMLVRRRHGSRRWEALEPLFPGYVFTRFQLELPAWSRIHWTPGVRRLLGGDTPVPVSDDVVAYLQVRAGECGYIVPRRALPPGTKVRFTEGPFDMLEAIIDRPVSRRDRVRVLLWLCGNSVSVEVPIDSLEVV
jgi:transcriptional antiterminator RfaH